MELSCARNRQCPSYDNNSALSAPAIVGGLQAFPQSSGLDKSGREPIRIAPDGSPVGSPRFALASAFDIFIFPGKRCKLPGNVCTTQETRYTPVNDHAIKDSITRSTPLPRLRWRLPAGSLGFLLTGVFALNTANALQAAPEEPPQATSAPASADAPALPTADDPVVLPETPDDAVVVPETGDDLVVLPQTAEEVVVLPETGDDPAQEGAPAYVPRRAPAQDYLDAIDRVEGEFGPYATELSDLYLGLGQTYLESGDYEQARDAFHRGVMAVRVNSGPNSPEQTNQLYLIANIEWMLGEKNTAYQVLHNIYFINSEYYGEESLELLPVLERIYEWYEVTWPAGDEKPKYADYARLRDLTEQMVDINLANYGEQHIETGRAYRRLGDAEFQIVRHLTDKDWMLGFTSTTLEPWGGSDVSVTEHYDDGRKAYKKSVEALVSDPSLTPQELAETLANQADWYMVFGYGRKARSLYEEAWQVLVNNMEDPALAENFLGQPRLMHFVDPPTVYLEELPPQLEEKSVNVSMTITRFGEARSVAVESPPEELSKQQVGDIERELRETPFRPAMKAGEVVTTEDFIWPFPVTLQETTTS